MKSARYSERAEKYQALILLNRNTAYNSSILLFFMLRRDKNLFPVVSIQVFGARSKYNSPGKSTAGEI